MAPQNLRGEALWETRLSDERLQPRYVEPTMAVSRCHGRPLLPTRQKNFQPCEQRTATPPKCAAELRRVSSTRRYAVERMRNARGDFLAQRPRSSPASRGKQCAPAQHAGHHDGLRFFPQFPFPPGPLAIESLQVDEQWIDPTRPSLRPLLLRRLGVSENVVIERMQRLHGGLNQGLWLLKDSGRELILKMVTSTRFMGMPTEAESFVELSSKRRQIANDPSIAFPIKIFHCTSSDGQAKDLIVMPKIAGECFAEVIAKKIAMGRNAELLADFEAFGTFLAGFHARHGLQHGDLQPANVIFAENPRRFALVDVAEMGSANIKECDVDHFLSGVFNLTRRHGQKMYDDVREAFQAGYTSNCS